MKQYLNYNFLKKNKIYVEQGEGKKTVLILSPFNLRSKNYKAKQEFIEKLRTFIITLSKECPSFNIEQFQNNFKRIKFKLYTDKSNKTSMVIFLKKKCKIYNMDSVYHELIHLASIRVEGSVEYCGLSESYYEYGDSFGEGLNEGYTQLIKERYFGQDERLVYPIEVKVASLIEQLVGQNFMEECFFKADLKKLCEKLQQYNSTNEIRYFLNNLDKLHSYINNLDVDNIKIQEIYNNINLFLFECFKNKSELENNKNILDEQIKSLFDTNFFLNYINKNEIVLNGLDKNLLDNYKGEQKNSIKVLFFYFVLFLV